MTDRIASLPSIDAVKLPCRAAALAAVTLAGLQTVDGEAMATGDRVLVAAQADAAENGIYLAAAGDWERSADFNGSYDIAAGTLVYVWGGAAGRGWYDIITAAPVVGEPIDWRHQDWHRPIVDEPASASGSSGAAFEGASTFRADLSAAAAAGCVFQVGPGASLAASGTATGIVSAQAASMAALVATAIGTPGAEGQLHADSPVWIFAPSYSASDDTQRYDLASDIVSVHAALATAQDGPWAAAGNATKAILGGGSVLTAACIKYTYASETTDSSATLGGTYIYRAGMQSATAGYFVGGYFSVSTTVARDKVVFSTEARTAGASLSTGRALHASQGNSTRGISAGGTASVATFVPVTTTNKHTYATDTSVGGSALAPGRLWLGAAGNTAAAIFSCGTDALGAETATSKKYTYAGDVVTAATSLSAAHSTLAGGGTNAAGLFHGPTGGGLTTATTLYDFSTDAVTAGTALYYSHDLPSMKAESPGGL